MKTKKIIRFLRNNFIAGAIVIIPIWVTVLLIRALVNIINKTFSLLPSGLQPRTYISFSGAEVVIAFIIILVLGFLANNIIGKKTIALGETVVSKIPVIKTVYQGVKHLTAGIVSEKKIFSRVVLLEFPIKGLKFIGFVTGQETDSIFSRGKKLLKIFIPTTPNPTSGFFCLASEEDVEILDISVDEAFKLIISAGYADLEKDVKKQNS